MGYLRLSRRPDTQTRRVLSPSHSTAPHTVAHKRTPTTTIALARRWARSIRKRSIRSPEPLRGPRDHESIIQRAEGVHNECSVVCKPNTVRNTQMNHSAGGTALWNRLETHGEMHTSFRGLLAVHLSHTTARSKRSEPSASPCPVSCPIPRLGWG